MPSRQDLQFRLEYALLRAIEGFVRLFPLEVSAALSARVWRLLAPLTKRHRRALENLALAFPDKSAAERKAIAMAHWENLGRVMAESMQIDRLLAQPERITLVNPEITDRYAGKMGAAVGVTLHMGNWELASWPMAQWGGKPAAIYRLVKNPYVDRYMRKQRQALFPGGLLAKGRAHGGSNLEGQKTARLIMDYVRRGGRLGVVCDLYDGQGMPVPFFGQPAKSTPIPAMIARRVGSRIWMVRCVRVDNRSRFRIEIRELKVPRTDSPSDDIRTVTAAMQRQFEDWVRECPEQWMWSNRRWR